MKGDNNPTLKRFAKRLVGLVGARGFNMAANVVALLLVARWVGPVKFATLAENQSLLMAISGFAALGIPLFALRAAARGYNAAVGFALFINLISTGVIASAGVVLAIMHCSLAAILVIPLAIAVALEKNQEVRIGLGVEFGKSRIINTMIVTRGVILVLGILGSGILAYDPLTAYVGSRFIGSTIAAIFMYRATNMWPMQRHPPHDGTMHSFGGFALGDVFASISSLDVWLVGIVSTPLNVGLYGAVNRLGAPISLFTGSLRTVIMGSATRSSDQQIWRGVRVAFFLSLVLIIPAGILAIFSPWLTIVILGSGYTGAAGALAGILLSVPAMMASPMIGTFLQASGYAGKIARNTGIWNVALLVLIAVGAFLWGATGAAAGTAITTWGKYFSLLIIAKKTYHHSIKKSND